LAALAVTIIGMPPNNTSASAFSIGDTVEVYNTGSSGLLVLDPACGKMIGGKFDGARGVALDGPVYCYNYNRWLIRWSDGLQGWSAENWLRKVSSAAAVVDNYPNVTSFSVSSTGIKQGESVTISYSVSDDVGLRQVELWREDVTAGITFRPIKTVSVSGKSYSGSFSDTPSSPGTYRYGLHVVDTNNEWNCERNSRTGFSPGVYGPKDVVVGATATSTSTPTGRIISPSSGYTVTSCPLTIRADASAPSGIAWVRFWAQYDGNWHEIITDSNGSDGWGAIWDCSSVSDQQVILTIWIHDNAGNEVWDPGGYVPVTLKKSSITPPPTPSLHLHLRHQCR